MDDTDSSVPCLTGARLHGRVVRLRQRGIAAPLDRWKLGLDALVFLVVRFHTNLLPGNQAALRLTVAGLTQILASYTPTGSHDAVLQFAVRDHVELRDLFRGLASGD